MAFLKNLLFAVVLSATLLSVSGQSHDLIVGTRQTGDQLMHQEKVEERFLWAGQKLVVTRDISVPYDHVITQVKALDQMNDDTGAQCTITSGGPDLNAVSLRFKSQRWHGIYFNIEVYAKRR